MQPRHVSDDASVSVASKFMGGIASPTLLGFELENFPFRLIWAYLYYSLIAQDRRHKHEV